MNSSDCTLGHSVFGFGYVFKIDLKPQEVYRQGDYVTSLGSRILVKSTTRLIRCDHSLLSSTHKVEGEGKDEGLTYFLPPGVTMGHEGEEHEDTPQSPSKENPSPPIDDGPWICASCGHTNVTAKSRCNGTFGEGLRCLAWRGGKRVRKPYFNKVRDVIERILEKNNEAEAIAADAYTELVPHVADLFTEQKDKKGMKGSRSEPSSPSSQTRQKIDLCSWKDERTHYKKSSSRIGSEFQVDTLPEAGSCTNPTNHTDADDGGAL